MTRKFLSYSLMGVGSFLLSAMHPVYGAEGVASPASYPADSWQGWSKATIRVLDRLESRSILLTLSVGEEQHYHSLSVKVLACVQRPPTLAPESAAQLHIEDSKAKDPTAFEGWILAKQPSLSLYQSPLYNVQVVQCDGQKVPPMMGPLPKSSVPQITSSEPEKLDADGQSVMGQAGLAPSSQPNEGAVNPVMPPAFPPNGAPSPSPEGALPPPTPLLP